MSVVYKRTEREHERERERDWETGSSRTVGGGYTTVRRYKVPDHSLEEDVYETKMQLVHRGRHDFDDRHATSEYMVERDRYAERSLSPHGRSVHEYRIERHVERSPSPVRHHGHQEIRISRDYERDLQLERSREQPYDLERYSRSTEYFRPEPQPQPQPQPIYIRNEVPVAPPAPQPIIIREEPQTIIIRERIPEPSYELVERKEITEDRQLVRPRQEEDYYYERRVKEVDRGGRRDERYVDERKYGRDRYGEEDYYSDDDVYIHKEKDTWGSEASAKRDVVAGTLAGIAAGQIVRHHRKRKGEAPGGSIGNALSYGTLGAVSAVALEKLNNRDRSRSLSSDRGRGRRDRHRSKSRHRSRSRAKEIGTLAALAGVGALAYAVGQREKKKNEQVTTVIEKSHRSRSRSRHGRRRSKSVNMIETDKQRAHSRSKHRSRSRSKHTDPEHRNNRAAQAGLASAAVAGLVEHRRSRSRRREGKRSPSRARKGVPIAAAGVTGAAVAGLYEKRKAKKERRAASKEGSRSPSRSVMDRLRGRSYSRPRSTHSEPVLIEYGGDPIYTERTKSRSRRHRRRSSSSSSRGRHASRKHSHSRSRSKSRARSVAETAAVAGVAGLAAHEAAKRRDKKKAEKERDRRREDDSAYSTETYSPYDSPLSSTAHTSTAHTNDSRVFPETNYFPPPPNAPVEQHTPYPPYNPADHQPTSQSTYEPQHPSQFVHQPPPPEGLNYGNPYAPPPQQHQHHDPYSNNHARRSHPDDNVSAPAPDRFVKPAEYPTRASPIARDCLTTDAAKRVVESKSGSESGSESEGASIAGSEAPTNITTRSEKTVQFDLKPTERIVPRDPSSPSPEPNPRNKNRQATTHHSHARNGNRDNHNHDNSDKKTNDEDDDDEDTPSDATIELSPRFDQLGRRRPEDPLADKLESVLLSLLR